MVSKELLPLSGFRDSLREPKSQLESLLREVFTSFGYIEMETPAIERADVLLGKYGPEAQKLLYLFEDNGGREVGLRYDLTVSLARYVAANNQSLNFPFKRFEIGPAWRGEKPQRGRYRQFTQADVDIVGDNSAVGSEQEVLEIIKSAEKALGIGLAVELNDRQLIEKTFDELEIEASKRSALLRLLDKSEKIKAETLYGQLNKLGLTSAAKKQVESLFLSDAQLSSFGQIAPERVDRLERLLGFASSIALKAKFSPKMVRGLDYYTGVVIEANSAKEPQLGSLIGGGRYDDLIGCLAERKLSGVGVSFGVDRLVELFKSAAPEGLFVVNFPPIENELRVWVNRLREKNMTVELFPDSAEELGKQLKYADSRGYKKVVIPFEELWEKGVVAVKDLTSATQQEVKRQFFESQDETKRYV